MPDQWRLSDELKRLFRIHKQSKQASETPVVTWLGIAIFSLVIASVLVYSEVGQVPDYVINLWCCTRWSWLSSWIHVAPRKLVRLQSTGSLLVGMSLSPELIERRTRHGSWKWMKCQSERRTTRHGCWKWMKCLSVDEMPASGWNASQWRWQRATTDILWAITMGTCNFLKATILWYSWSLAIQLKPDAKLQHVPPIPIHNKHSQVMQDHLEGKKKTGQRFPVFSR